MQVLARMLLDGLPTLFKAAQLGRHRGAAGIQLGIGRPL